MESCFEEMKGCGFKVIVLDAWYRFMEEGADENSNADATRMYNLLDKYAHMLGCAFVCIHHTAKGNQSGKAITDVGAGAGAQSRAADSHLVIRQHEEPDCFVIDAVARSWPPPKPICMRFQFPLWDTVPDLDPTKLKSTRAGKVKATGGEKEKEAKWEPTAADVVNIVRNHGSPIARDEIISRLKSQSCSASAASRAVKEAERNRLLKNLTSAANKPSEFVVAEEPAPVCERESSSHAHDR